MNLSVLNLAPLKADGTFEEAMDTMVRLAQKAEELGYVRYWLAEHHNTKSFGSSATVLLIQHTLANTKTIRVGSGGIMLPNHSPYVVAEQFGTLEKLYPGRVDLGLGRAPGTDQNTARVLRRTNNLYSDFSEEVAELESYFKDTALVHAYPAAGLNVPFYILGSSTDSAYLAAHLGLPYAFASHFAPAMMQHAVDIYRRYFKPSEYLDKPYVILGVNVVAADTDEEAERLGTTSLQSFLNITTGRSQGLMPPMENEQAVWDQLADQVTNAPHFGPVKFNKEDLIRDHKAVVENMRAVSFQGSVQTIQEQYKRLKHLVRFDEIMAVSFIYDTEAMLHSYELLKQAIDEVENKK